MALTFPSSPLSTYFSFSPFVTVLPTFISPLLSTSIPLSLPLFFDTKKSFPILFFYHFLLPRLSPSSILIFNYF